MQEPLLRKLFLAFIQVHILHHASCEAIYGSWMIDELNRHGYEMTAGTMYPIFHGLEKDGLLVSEKVQVNGKVRKYYTATEKGKMVLEEANKKASEFSELKLNNDKNK